ncbi:MAG: hypothetical protein N3E49_09575, partial [Bacteroidia bacterium]|nr:hypothetical protein [Bacteroidia bacterium]
SAKALKELTQATQSVEKAVKSLSEVQKARERVERQLKILTDESAKSLFKLKDQAKELTAELRAAAASERAAGVAAEYLAQAQKAAAAATHEEINTLELLRKVQTGVFESYFDLQDTLENLRQAYKDLAAQGKAFTDEGRQIAAAVAKLDAQIKGIDASVGQFQRNVGNYAGGIRQFFVEFQQQAGQAGGALGFLAQGLTNMGIAFRAAGGGLAGLAASVRVLGATLRSLGIVGLISLAAEGISFLADKIKGFVQSFSADADRIRKQLDVERELIALQKQAAAAARELEEAEEKTEALISKRYDAE